MTVTATVKGLRTVRYIPKAGEHQLSINLGMADAEIVFKFAAELGVKPEIVQIPTVSGIEIHALLVCEAVDHSPLGDALSEKLDELTLLIPHEAIRHVYGHKLAA